MEFFFSFFLLLFFILLYNFVMCFACFCCIVINVKWRRRRKKKKKKKKTREIKQNKFSFYGFRRIQRFPFFFDLEAAAAAEEFAWFDEDGGFDEDKVAVEEDEGFDLDRLSRTNWQSFIRNWCSANKKIKRKWDMMMNLNPNQPGIQQQIWIQSSFLMWVFILLGIGVCGDSFSQTRNRARSKKFLA